MTDYSKYADFAVELARQCGQLARNHASFDISVEPKGDNSPVTLADIKVNRLVIERCKRAFPDIGVLGEEESYQGRDSHLLWVCDPIDGTGPYVYGMAASTFLLALVEDGKPVVGVVYDFMNDRLCHAVQGGGAFLNGQPIAKPDYPPLKVINYEWWQVQAVKMRGFHELWFADGYQVTNYASAGIMGLQVVLGRIAGEVSAGTSAWDFAALQVLADESGCIMRDIDGNEQRYDGPINGAVIARPDFYERLLLSVNRARSDSLRD